MLGIAPSLVNTSQDFVANMNSCPSFAGSGTLLAEGDCAWGRVTGGFIDRSGDSSTVGYDVKSLTSQLGGQKEVAPDWFLGGSVAYQLSRLDGDDDSAEVDGNGLMAGAILKRQMGQLLLSGAVNAGYGWYDSSRNIDVATGQSQAKGSPDAINGGLHARAAYELPHDAWYLRPTLSLDANYVRIDGYNEHGGSPSTSTSTPPTRWS